MKRPLILLLTAALILTACGFRDSRLNPLNWFGQSREVAASPGQTNPLIPNKRRGLFDRPDVVYAGRPIDQIATMAIERVPGGAIVRATGVAATQGPWDARLIPANEENLPVDGVLAFELKVVRPARQPVGPTQSREVTVATSLTDQDLIGVRTIRVSGARNAREARR